MFNLGNISVSTTTLASHFCVEERSASKRYLLFFGFTLAAALAVGGCQTVTRTEVLHAPSLSDGYQATNPRARPVLSMSHMGHLSPSAGTVGHV